MADSNLKKLLYKTYLAVIEGSIGTKMFQHAYVERADTSVEMDVMDTGDLSCAFHVSGVLTIMRYIDHPSATVASALKSMQEAGWVETDTPKQGDVIHWDKHPVHGTEHLGFYWDTEHAVSNSFEQKVPVMHDIYAERKVLDYWTRDFDTTLSD